MALPFVAQLLLSVILPVVITVVLLLVHYYFKNVRPKAQLLSKLPVLVPTAPFLGSTPYLKKGPEFRLQLFDACLKKNMSKGIGTLWLGWLPTVYIWKADYVEKLLTSHEIKKSFSYRFLKPWLGDGLVMTHGDRWLKHRKLLTPAFHFKILNDFVPSMNERAELLVETLEKHIGKGEVDIFPLVTLAALDVICEVAMGQTTGEEDRKARENVCYSVLALCTLTLRRTLTPWLWPDLIFSRTKMGQELLRHLKIIKDYTNKIFRERAESFDREAIKSQLTDSVGQRRPLPFLDLLLYTCENFTKLTQKDIIDEVNVFLFTGHDTTAAGMAWTIYCLGRHPEAQKKVHEELDAVFGSSNRPVAVEDIKELRYLSACLKEALRIYPAVPRYARELEHDMKFGEHVVPAGSIVVVTNEILHRDPVYFEEPEKFKPERFLINSVSPSKDVDDDDGPQGKQCHPFAYVPFSAGQRNCIGQKYAQMEDKIMLASIFRRFKIECSHTEEELAPAIDVVLRPTNGMFINVQYR